MIRRRYPREAVPDDAGEPNPAAITLYCNDERTPLPDPHPNDADDADSDPVADVVAGSVSELRALLSPPMRDGDIPLPDEFEDGIFGVYGPPSKRPRHSIPDPECDLLESQLQQVSQQPAVISEESSATTNMTLVESDTVAHKLCTKPHTETVPDVQSRMIASTLDFVAANVQADRTDDGPLDDSSAGSPTGGDSCQITQDEDLDPRIFAEIAHQFERVAEDSTNDELFDRIDGHLWQDGALMFKVQWKTDEVSMLPFSTVKNDFPCEAATYVLKHKLGSSSGRYTGGRYTRWARQFNRHYDRIVRRMFRLSDGSADTDDPPGSPRIIRVASNLPNGTRLI